MKRNIAPKPQFTALKMYRLIRLKITSGKLKPRLFPVGLLILLKMFFMLFWQWLYQ
jgi:hypothetical protein